MEDDDPGNRLWHVMERQPEDIFRVIVGKVGRTSFAAEPFRPVLAFGPQRSRKTTGVVVPALLEWDGPALVTSVREDVIEQTISSRKQRGRIYIFDPARTLLDWPDTVGWNPLELIEDWDSAKRVGDVLIESGSSRKNLQDADFWYSAAKQLIAPHLYAAARNGYTMADVVRWIKTQEEFEVRSLLQAIGEDIAIEAAEAAWAREDRARSSIYTTAQVALDVWDHAGVLQSSGSEPRIHIEEFLDGGENTLYLCAPPDAQEEYAPIFSTLVREIVRIAYIRNRHFAGHVLGISGAKNAMAESPGVVPLLLLLDEAGNVAPLNNLGTLATTAAGTAIQLVTVFHDLSQMINLYGEARARSIVNNHSVLLVLPGNRDPVTATLFVNMLGGEKVHGWVEERPTISSIRRLQPGTALCVYENLPPVILELRSSLMDSDLLRKREVKDGA